MKTDIKLKSHQFKTATHNWTADRPKSKAVINRLSSRFLFMSHPSWKTLNAGRQTRDQDICSTFRASMNDSKQDKAMFVLAELLWACPECFSGACPLSSPALSSLQQVQIFLTTFPVSLLGEFTYCGFSLSEHHSSHWINLGAVREPGTDTQDNM